MTNPSYSTSFTVEESPEAVFAAIKNVRAWWGEDIEGNADNLGEEFAFRVEGIHYSKQKITDFVPNQKIVWLITEAELSFTQDKEEWKGTEVIFEIAEKDGKTEVLFTHKGLVPDFECFDTCSTTWGSIIRGSLRSLITSGKGQPFQKKVETPPVKPLSVKL
jgi:hypothetical protein